jgi:large subunit ribosomal protein L9
MNSTNVILRESVPNLGESGDLVTVKPGFARNYLLPRGLAFEATEANIRRLEEDRRRAEERAKRDFLEAHRQASAIEQVSLTFHARAGEESKLFGSITTADIAERLNAEGNLGFEVDRRQIELDEPLKTLGVFNVPVKLHGDVRPEIKVWVIKEE